MPCKKRGQRPSTAKNTLGELALRNVKRSAKDYQIYFLTLTLAVALFYTFNSISSQFRALGIHDRYNFLSFSAGIMAGVSVFICVIIGFLVMYANRFMLKRRKREIGIYMTLGMEQKDIGRMMWRETLIIGGFSLAAGLAVGILLSQGLSLITAKIIDMEVQKYRIVLSARAFLSAFFFFGLMFFIVYRLNIKEIGNMQLVDLMAAGRKNERAPEGGLRDLLLFLASVCILAGGHYYVFDSSQTQFLPVLFTGSALMAAGTILFFLSVSGLMIKLCKRNRKFYYSRLNMFVVSQIGSRIKSAGLSMAMVSILTFLSMSSIALGLSSGKSLSAGKEGLAPYDVSIQVRKEDRDSLKYVTVEEVFQEEGIRLSDYISASADIRIYTADEITNHFFEIESEPKGTGGTGTYNIYLMGVEDYNRTTGLAGEPPISLGDSEYAVNYNVREAAGKLEYFEKWIRRPVTVNGVELHLAQNGIYNRVYFNQNVFFDGGTLVVPQSVLDEMEPEWIGLNGTFVNQDSYEAFSKIYLDLKARVSVQTQEDIMVQVASNNLVMTYVGTYLGITFLIMAGAVLALQQLSQSSDNEKRYALLRRLGTREEDIKNSLFAQLSVYFGLPFALAMVNAYWMTVGVGRRIPYLSRTGLTGIILFSTILVTLIYGLYFLVTYAGSRRILRLR